MKVQDILNESVPGQIPVVHLSAKQHFSAEKLKAQFIGDGFQSDAYKHNTSQSSILKVIHLSEVGHDETTADSAGEFIQLCYNHQDNPFFPKIYKVKKYVWDKAVEFERPGPYNSEARSIIVVEMEKLHPITEGQLHHVAQKIFESLGLSREYFISVASKYTGKPVEAFQDRSITSLVSYAFNKDPEGIKKHTKNPKLAEAIDLLVTTKHNGQMDLHAGNMMFRMTNIGPQLVLVDPWS
ncbi:MAG: hypothetical protein DRJ15_12615 [Bacteroidetes bacterium]|nr:MAG: hypothetical protein DRJ15_12615 [Bacteroidota bacterium]